jgi:hypothetical protein
VTPPAASCEIEYVTVMQEALWVALLAIILEGRRAPGGHTSVAPAATRSLLSSPRVSTPRYPLQPGPIPRSSGLPPSSRTACSPPGAANPQAQRHRGPGVVVNRRRNRSEPFCWEQLALDWCGEGLPLGSLGPAQPRASKSGHRRHDTSAPSQR